MTKSNHGFFPRGQSRCLLLFIVVMLFSAAFTNAAQITWTNTVSGNWETAQNWSPNQVPGPNDSVIISKASSLNVTLTASESVSNLNLSLGRLLGTNMLSASGTVYLNGGVIAVPVMMANGAQFYFQGGDISGTIYISSGGFMTLTNLPTSATFGNYNSGNHLTNIATLINDGTVICSNVNPTFYNSSLQNQGYWSLGGDNDFRASTTSSSNLFINSGVFEKTTGSNTSTFDGTWYFTNTGTFNCKSGNILTGWFYQNSGNINITSGYLAIQRLTQNGGATLLTGGSLQASQGYGLLGGTLTGTNTISGNLTNSASIFPGLPTGTLTIQYSYTQTASGKMTIYIEGASPSVSLGNMVVGTASLAGTLSVIETNGFMPALYTNYTFLTGSISGVFNNYNLYYLPGTQPKIRIHPLSPSFSVYVSEPVGPGLYNGNFFAHLFGTPGTNYTIETTPTLFPPQWQKISNGVASASDVGYGLGVLLVNDPMTPTNRFYRAVSPAY